MKARIFKTLVSTGSAARDFIREVCGSKPAPSHTIADATTRGAPKILEVFRNHGRQRESDFILTGTRVIAAMNEQLRDYRSAGEQFADWITRGCTVSISGDDRPFTVMAMWWDDEAIKIRDDEGHTYVVPFKVVGPWPKANDEYSFERGTDDESNR